jgi:hypothetical protein
LICTRQGSNLQLSVEHSGALPSGFVGEVSAFSSTSLEGNNREGARPGGERNLYDQPLEKR